MTFEEAIMRSIENYFRGMEPEKLNKEMPGRVKYSKKYFDKFERDKFGESVSDKIEKGDWS